MPPGNDVGMGLTRGGVVFPAMPSLDGGGVVAGEVLLLLGGDLLLDLSSLQKDRPLESSNSLNMNLGRCVSSKGQIKLKADWRTIDSPKTLTNKFVYFAMTVRKYLKLNIWISSFKYFRTVKQKQNQIDSFGFWENLRHANLLTVLSDH